MNNANNILLLMGGGADGGAFSMQLLLLSLVFLIMYFFMIRPQKKRIDEAQRFINNLKTGDKIVSVGGIHGTIVEIPEQSSSIIVKIDSNTRVRLEKSAISADLTKVLQNSVAVTPPPAK